MEEPKRLEMLNVDGRHFMIAKKEKLGEVREVKRFFCTRREVSCYESREIWKLFIDFFRIREKKYNNDAQDYSQKTFTLPLLSHFFYYFFLSLRFFGA